MLYFWAVAKEGSITRAAERLRLSVQTISTQLGQFERQLGHALFAPQGRSLMLTEAGRTANGALPPESGNWLKVGIGRAAVGELPFGATAPLSKPPFRDRLIHSSQ